jgi:hypothetical protein
MTTKHPFPDRLTLRDTKVNADEGQRIYSTATGYGYEWCEYVRADLASPPSPAPAESGAVAEPVGFLNAQGGFLLTDSGASWLKGAIAATKRDDLPGQPAVAVFANPPAPSASMGRVTEAMVEAGCRALAGLEVSPTLDAQIERIETTWARYRHEVLAVILAALDSLPDHGGGEGEPAMSTELVERLRAGPIRTGDTEDGEYELFDIEEAAQTMHEAADELTALTAKVALLTEALEWYGERARLARLIHSGGDPARFELSDDGGKRARRALSEPDKEGTW